MPDTNPKVSVIVVSFNTAAMTLDCLRSVEAGLAELPAEILVVDNASTDGSPEAIRAAFPALRLMANQDNIGFGGANNQAMREARGEFLLLLNSDAFPKPGAIAALVAFLAANPQVGAVGARLLNRDGSLQRSCWRFPTPARAWLENVGITSVARNHPVLGDYHGWDHASDRRVDFVIGACLLVRKEVYTQVGGFDERFFMYAEESDWQRRMWDAGWQVAFTPSAEATHLGGASGANEPARVNRYFFDSLDRYTLKHHGRLGVVSLRLAMAAGCLLRVPVYAIAALRPARRPRALSKVRLHSWLLARQLTDWRIFGGSGARDARATAPGLRLATPPSENL